MSSTETVKKFNKLKEKLNKQGLDFILTGELVLYLFYGLDREVSEINLVVTDEEEVNDVVKELGYSDCVEVNELKFLDYYDLVGDLKVDKPEVLVMELRKGQLNLKKLYDLVFLANHPDFNVDLSDLFRYSLNPSVIDYLISTQGSNLSDDNINYLMVNLSKSMQDLGYLVS